MVFVTKSSPWVPFRVNKIETDSKNTLNHYHNYYHQFTHILSLHFDSLFSLTLP